MEQEIRGEIARFIRDEQTCRFPDSGLPYFDEPLIGLAAAGDPLFTQYRTVIGPFHQTPAEVLPGAATVFCWSLPITRATRETNRGERRFPSREWAWTRSFGEQCNTALRRRVVALLEGAGHRAVAPQLAPGWRELADPTAGIASTWSERHAAHAAGLGTFSLSGALITVRGVSHRLGSVITDLALPPTPRPYKEPGEWCLFLANGTCGVCVERCPAGSIARDGRNKIPCRDHVYGSAPATVAERYGVTATGCGLCQTRVPCEGRIPAGLAP
jgi:epoxyqueuosine reductase QueG